jgi:hypothetical protein
MQKQAIIFVISVRPSVWKNSDMTLQVFVEFYMRMFRKPL